jgi:hypothetical protein
MARKLIAALAATAGLALASQAGATVFTLDSIDVSAYTIPPNADSEDGLGVTIINHVNSPLTFDLAAEDPQSFALFTIYTTETWVHNDLDDDLNPQPISLGFNFSAPTPNNVGDIGGNTVGFTGLFQGGTLNWDTGTSAFTWGPGNTGLMTISVNGGNFNTGILGTTQGGCFFHHCWTAADKGLTVYGTFDWDNDPVAVPEPATWALMIGGFGMAGAMIRRRRALALG